MDLHNLPDDLRRQVEDELEPRETITWVGQPQPQGFHWITLFPFLFSIPWTLFSIFWMLAASGLIDGFLNGGQAPQQMPPGGRLVFSLFGLPFVLIGVGLMSSPWWTRRSLRRRGEKTAYVVTNRRALIFDGGFAGMESQFAMNMMFFGGLPFLPSSKEVRIRSLYPEDLTHIERIQRADGSGNVILQRGRTSVTFPFSWLPQTPDTAFYSIPDVRIVEQHIRDLKGHADATIA